MILVDSSVWIDYFNGRTTVETNTLDALLGVEPLGIGDVMLTEVLRGFRSDKDYQTAKKTDDDAQYLWYVGHSNGDSIGW